MASIKVLNNLTVYDNVSALSAIYAQNLVALGSLSASNVFANNVTANTSLSTGGTLYGATLSAPHNHAASDVIDFYSAALSATYEQTVIYSLIFGG